MATVKNQVVKEGQGGGIKEIRRNYDNTPVPVRIFSNSAISDAGEQRPMPERILWFADVSPDRKEGCVMGAVIED